MWNILWRIRLIKGRQSPNNETCWRKAVRLSVTVSRFSRRKFLLGVSLFVQSEKPLKANGRWLQRWLSIPCVVWISVKRLFSWWRLPSGQELYMKSSLSKLKEDDNAVTKNAVTTVFDLVVLNPILITFYFVLIAYSKL